MSPTDKTIEILPPPMEGEDPQKKQWIPVFTGRTKGAHL
jgi:hypothetical protein